MRRVLGRSRPKPVSFVPGSTVPADWPAALNRERKYVARPASWPVTVLSTSAYSTFCGSLHLGWAPLLQGWSECTAVPGDHNSMIGEPYVHVLAGTLRESLERAGADVANVVSPG